MSTQSKKRASEPPKRIRRRRCKLETCNQLFTPKRKWQKFCSDAHRAEYYFKAPVFRKFELDIRALIRKMVKPHCLK